MIMLLAGLRSDDPVTVQATVETDPVPSGGDAADDPAIWVHPEDPARSTVIGTDKAGGGLAVYGLDGRQIQYLACGRMNNVDLRYDFPLGGKKVDLVSSGNRKDDTLGLFRIDPHTGKLENVAARPIRLGIRAYGSCMYRGAKTGAFYAFVNSPGGEMEQYELTDDGNGRVDARRVRAFSLGGIVEGCVADDELGHLYIGEESVGIWKYAAEPEGGTDRTLVDRTGREGHLTADVEGLAIYHAPGGKGYLLASSQGSNSFAVYRREGSNEYVMTFRIGAGRGIDAVRDCDGIEVVSAALGDRFPRGLFVAQDGDNEGGSQNFKLVRWEEIAEAANPPLAVDASWNPRRPTR
jgi:3-phytase